MLVKPTTPLIRAARPAGARSQRRVLRRERRAAGHVRQACVLAALPARSAKADIPGAGRAKHAAGAVDAGETRPAADQVAPPAG